MNSVRKIFRRVRTLLWTALTLLTVLAAVVVGIGKLVMPYSVHYQPELEAWLSKAFSQPVEVESFSGEWKAFGPHISLQGVKLVSNGVRNAIAINRAALDIKPLNALIPGRPLYSFRIIGANLSLQRTPQGRYVLSGLGMGKAAAGKNSNSSIRDVALNGEVRLQDISLVFDDPERDIHVILSKVNGRLKMSGSRMAAEIQARLTDRDRRRVVGDLDAIVRVRLDSDQRLVKARWHVKTGELMLAELVKQLPHHALIPVSGRLNAELWGEWQLGNPQEMLGVVDLREAQLSSQSGPLMIDHLNSRFNFQFTQRKEWRLDLSDLTVEYAGEEWQSHRFSLARNIPANLGLWVSADYVELDYPIQLTQRIMAYYHTQWPETIPHRAQGGLEDFDLVLDARWHLLKSTGQLKNGRFWGWNKGPDIEGINARIELDAGFGNVNFNGTSTRLDWLSVFRRPVMVSMDDCRLEALWAGKDDWQVDLNHCHLENEDISAAGRVRFASDDGKPLVDINVSLERGDISRFGDYWPENVMKERTLHWLRTSLLKGQVSKGRYSMVGDMDDFPFKNHRGVLQAVATVENAEIKYAESWPAVREVSAIAYFEGPGMYVEGQVGNTAGAIVDTVTARIEDFKRPVLDVSYQASSTLPTLVGFLKQTPLLDHLSLDTDQFVLKGDAGIDGRIHTRLGQTSESMNITGELSLKESQFTDTLSGVVLNGISGALSFDRDGLKAVGLNSIYREDPVSLDISSDWDAVEVFRAHLNGVLPVEKVIPDELFARESLFKKASGTSTWDINLSVLNDDESEEREIWLEIFSELDGVSIDLPAPLKKPADSVWPLTVRYPIRTKEHILSADMMPRLQLQMELSKEDGSPVRAAVRLGGKVQDLPGVGLLVIDGLAPTFDLDSWIDLTVDRLSETEEVGGLTLQAASVEAEQAMIFNRHFDDVGLNMSYEDGIITGNFDCPDINGTVRYYKNEAGAHSMSGEFERLIMPDPVAGGMTMESDPALLPEMHFYSKEFSYLGLNLGETRMEGYPVKNGFHIESIEAQSPSLVFNARGDWLKDDAGERSDFNIRISSESLGNVLDAMDVSSAMQGGQTLIRFDAWWNGTPAEFALERLNGEMDLSVIQGSILTANSGAGRMLGLLSLSELPRRLAMDFRDVFDEGFSFDEARGTMLLENGNSFTDDLTLSSTAAKISITGNTDLVAQTFDYEFSVQPGVSKTLPVIGALAGGPVGAAAGLALQAVFRDALGEATEARYKISGPWSDPQVERIDKVPDVSEPDTDQDTGAQPQVRPEEDSGSDPGTAGQQSMVEDSND